MEETSASLFDCCSIVEYSFLISRSQSWWHFCPTRFVCFLHRDHCHDCRVGGSRSFSFSWHLCLFAFNSSRHSLWQTFVEQWKTCVWKIDFDLPRPFLHSRTHFDGRQRLSASGFFKITILSIPLQTGRSKPFIGATFFISLCFSLCWHL